jgi:hypothetical protein
MTKLLGLYKDLPFADYLAVDAFSNSDMKHLARSAWHWKHRVVPTVQTRAMLRGSLAHFSVTQMQLRALAAEPTLSRLLATGYSECSVFWVDKDTGVYCKARPDHVCPVDDKTVQLIDIKSTVDESPVGFGRAAARLGYHRQAAHYTEGFKRATGMNVEAFVFAAVTSQPPVLAVPYVLTDEIAAQAVDERRELMELYARCQREGVYPAYGAGYQILDFPAWAKASSEVEVAFAE